MKLATTVALFLASAQAFTSPRAVGVRRSTSLNVADDAKVILITGSSQGKDEEDR